MTTAKPLPREKQWTRNSAARRQAIKEAGGRQILVMVQPETNKLLNEIIAMRTKSDPSFSLTKWVAKMIERDHSELKRLKQRRAKAAAPTG